VNVSSYETNEVVTSRAAMLSAMLAVVRVTPEALDAVSADDRAAYLWGCHQLAEELRAAVVGPAGAR
jgi:hypothetical protein